MDPRKVGSAWEVFAPAKLNLYLEVLGRRSDGFHELETLMLPVRIYDHLIWSPPSNAVTSQEGCSLRVRSLLPSCQQATDPIPQDKDNLVLRAANLLARRAGCQPRGTFELFKRIPSQAGLGGGSSDAAAALKIANTAWGIDYDNTRLTELAAELGSDVPFFINSRAAICRGRGERMEPVGRLPQLNFVVVKPEVGSSTVEVFQEFAKQDCVGPSIADVSHERLQTLVGHLQRGALCDAAKRMKNRLEEIVAARHEQIGRISQALASVCCLGNFMTGSGSACIGLAPSARGARRMANLLTGMNLGSVFATSSC